MRRTDSKQLPVVWFMAVLTVCALLSACESPRGLQEAGEDLTHEEALSADGGGGGGDGGYVAPPELTNPLYLPPEQISAAQNICGASAHYASLGACTSAVGSSFSISGKQCKVKQASNVRFNGLTHCCISCELNANTAFNNFMGLGGATNIQLAPMTQPGCGTPGTFTGVTNPLGVYGAIVSAAGINACTTNPVDLKGRPGFLAFTDNSGVLNEGSSRSTFGYFVQSVQNGQTVTYFVLFSYDKAADGNCATELFLFGPVVQGQSPPLVMGLAIDKDGNLLSEVPLNIANVSNYIGGDSEAVKPGVSPNQGCRACHSNANSGPNETQPFPWGGRPPRGADGGVMDPCAPADAGTSDAGTSDAGSSDAGASDAGTGDAGIPDAGPRDAGTSDAGTVKVDAGVK
ncbi:hypothetical protein [Pyxidicoccus sp. MSG2]|uniref:hypothetical protein n=1 Tax=Pyxidicoccus sp. MSG2 TaxID=2996790 RepID=UPI00226FC821|nr:hypothetical protein [Pyxidicoccus sp. MSG2]MCY1017629.1 hypothetical protein [Pyxidicoccus sp. MSG2]